MAFDPADLLRPPPSASQVAPVPLAGTRGQAMQRLQVGLFGLAAMVLLVALANIIMNNAEQNQATVVPEAASTVSARQSSAPASDPLAGAGVVPEMPAEPAEPAAPPAEDDALSPQP